MSILLNKDTTFIVQGITGREAINLTRECLDYGSKIVGGVTPGRKGREVHGVGTPTQRRRQDVFEFRQDRIHGGWVRMMRRDQPHAGDQERHLVGGEQQRRDGPPRPQPIRAGGTGPAVHPVPQAAKPVDVAANRPWADPEAGRKDGRRPLPSPLEHRQQVEGACRRVVAHGSIVAEMADRIGPYLSLR